MGAESGWYLHTDLLEAKRNFKETGLANFRIGTFGHGNEIEPGTLFVQLQCYFRSQVFTSAQRCASVHFH